MVDWNNGRYHITDKKDIKRAKRARIQALALSDPKSWDRVLWNLAGSQTESGENVTEYSALALSAVWNAVELISSTIAALPLNLMQIKNGVAQIADNRRLYGVMHDRFNPYMTAKRGRECLTAHVLTWGNGYAEKVVNGYGEVIELWPIAPDRVTPKMQDGELVYEIRMPVGGPLTLSRDKILHILGPSFDGFTGYSRIAMARRAIGLGMAMETFGSRYFGKGTHPSAVISHPGQLKDPKSFREGISQVYGGLGESHLLMVLEEDMKINMIGYPPEDSQFLQSRQFQIPEIARWFNLPPHKLKDLTKSSFNNIESEDASFIRDRLIPDIVDLEQAYGMQLLTDSDRGRFYFKHNLKGLLRADTAARTAFYTAMLDRGVFCIDDVLELEDMPPLPNGLGQKRFVQMNMVLLENAEEESIKQPQKALKFPALIEGRK